MVITLYFIIILIFYSVNCSNISLSSDEKIIRNNRQLLFSANCVLQFAVGVAVPAKVRFQSMAANGGILLNLELPNNLTQFFSPYTRTQKVSHHGLLEVMHNLSGMDGRSCIQKSICQLKEVPFTKRDNLFQQIIKILFSPKPSNTTAHTDCDAKYPLCPTSMIDFLTEIYVPQ